MQNTWKKILILLVVISLLTIVLCFAATAAEATALDGKIGLYANRGAFAVDGTTITYTNKISGVSLGTSYTITITNNCGSKAEVSFSYSGATFDTFNFNGGAKSGTYSAILENGSSISITASSQCGFGGQNDKLVISNLTVTPITSTNITYKYDSTLGSITVDGSAVSDGAILECTNTETGVALVATPNSGVQFLGWINEDTNELLSSQASTAYLPSKNMSVKAVFVESGSKPWFGVGAAAQHTEGVGLLELGKLYYYSVNTTYLFDDLNVAAQAAKNGTSKTVVLMNSGTLSLGTYTIPSGVTLLIPFDSANTMYTTQASTTGTKTVTNADGTTTDVFIYETPTAYRKLTLASGANLVINGSMSVSAKHKIVDTSYTGAAPTGKVGWVQMENGSTITVNNGGALYTYGYITGQGTVIANNGASVYEMFQIEDFRGGKASTDGGMKSYKVFPLSQYYIQNIEVPQKINAGAKLYGMTTIWMSSTKFPTTVMLVGGSSDNAMFKLSDGYVTKAYNGEKDRTEYEINASMTLNNLVINIGGTDINSKDYVLPINNMHMTLKSGKTCTISQDIAVLPGTTMVIEEGAKAVVANGYSATVYDLDNWGGYCFPDTKFRPVTYAPGRTGTRSLFDATILVNGTLEGAIYSTSKGANVYSSNKGIVTFAPGSKVLTTAYQYIQSQTKYDEIAITPVQLKNADGKYVSTGADTYTYDSTTGTWNCTNHAYDDGKETTAPTCTVAGVKTYTCIACGNTKTEEISTLGHDLVDVEAKAATCTEPGHNAHKDCSRCDYTEGKEEIPALGHSYGEGVETTAPTCSAEGVMTYTCQNDSSHTYTEAIAATGNHAAGTAVEENRIEATCGKDGSYDSVVKCSVCETEMSRTTNTIPATGNHTPGAEADCENAQICTVCQAELKAALDHEWTDADCDAPKTCSVCGATEGEALGHTWADADCDTPKTCSVCGATEGEALGHKWTDATCTAPKTCSVCGETEGEALGHTWTDADCDTPKTCSVCGATEGEALGHTKDTKVENRKPANCTVDGSYENVVYCTVCKEELSRETVTVDALGHTAGETVVEKKVDADCGTAGSYDNVICCTVCGEEISRETVTVDALGHTAGETVVENKVDADCETAGSYDNVICCTVCGEELSRETVTVDALGHKYGAVVTAPTCTNVGYTTYTCSVCGDTYKADEVAATGHSYTEEVTKAATCTEAGVKTFTCTCGDTYTKEITATGHTLTQVEAKAPTCTEAGYEAYEYCSACDYTTYKEVAATGHSYFEEVTKAATCTEAGEKTFTCSTCGDTYTEAIKATGHTEVTIPAVEAGCETEGYTAGIQCSVCKMMLEDVTPIPAKGHKMQEFSAAIAPTCSNAGKNAVKTCTNGCGKTEGGEEIPALDHEYDAEVTAPTCTADGYTTYTCSVCGDSYTSDQVSASGHSYSTAVTTPPTCTAPGVKTFDCIKCEFYYTESIPANGHAMVHHDAVAPGCTTDGTVEYWSCSKCEKNYAEVAGATVLESVVDAAKGHSYGEPVWNWTGSDADGYSAAAVTFTCHCTHYETVNGTVENQTTAATTEADGKIVYTATAAFDKKEYSDSKTVVIPKIEIPKYAVTIDDRNVISKGTATTTLDANMTYAAGETFTVTSSMACVIAISTDGGVNYMKLSGTIVEGQTDTYQYTIPTDIQSEFKIAFMVKGDVTGDGYVKTGDYKKLKDYLLEKVNLTALEKLAGDVTGDGNIKTGDYKKIKDYLLDKTTL